MSRIIQCPKCEKSLRISDEKAGAAVTCPKCSTRFRAADDSNDFDTSNRGRKHDEDEFGEVPASRPRSRKAAKKPGTALGIQPFLKYWLMGLGGVLALIALIGIGGIFNEVVAITASALCVVVILVCALAGTIWTAIDLGRQSIGLALCVLLVPASGPILAWLKKGPVLRGAIVYVSMFAPGILLGMMLLVYLPKYNAGGAINRTAKLKSLIHQLDERMKPDTPIVTARFRVASRPGALDGIQPKCEALLLPFKSYVPGSLQIDAPGRIITYQYRGGENFDKLMGYYLSNATGAFIPQQNVAPGEK